MQYIRLPRLHSYKCDQIGLFLKVLGTNFLAKVAQYMSNFGLFLNTSLWEKNCCGYFLDKFFKKLGYFLVPTSGHTELGTYVRRILFCMFFVLMRWGERNIKVIWAASFRTKINWSGGGYEGLEQANQQIETHSTASGIWEQFFLKNGPLPTSIFFILNFSIQFLFKLMVNKIADYCTQTADLCGQSYKHFTLVNY